jgi:hypothetical protein
LHGEPDIVRALRAVGCSDLVEHADGIGSCVGADFFMRHTRLEIVTDSMGDGTTEDDQIQERVGSEAVGTVDGNASSLTACEETWNNLILALAVNCKNFTGVFRWDTTHIIVDSWQDGNRLLSNIDTGEDRGGLRDTRETLVENLGWQVAELKVDVVLIRSNTASFTDFHSH